jgi:hypothetical protein
MMPSTSKKQHNFMAAVANNPSFAKKVGVPQSVGKEFNQADKSRKFSKGGDTMASKMNPGFMAMMAKKKAGAKKMAGGGMPMKDGKPAFIGDGKGAMKHGGMTKAKKMNMGGMSNGGSASKRADGIAIKGNTKGTEIGMKRGGKAC